MAHLCLCGDQLMDAIHVQVTTSRRLVPKSIELRDAKVTRLLVAPHTPCQLSSVQFPASLQFSSVVSSVPSFT